VGLGTGTVSVYRPPTLTIAGAAAPEVTLTLVLWAVAGGALALFPSLVYLFRIFKRS